MNRKEQTDAGFLLFQIGIALYGFCKVMLFYVF